MAEGVGNAPTSAHADPVVKTGAASLYLPAFHKFKIENADAECFSSAFCTLHSAFKNGCRLGLATKQAA